MNYWLVKSEPHKYSWEQFNKDGLAVWDGVRNFAARNNLRDMRVGDLVLFYHSNEGCLSPHLSPHFNAFRTKLKNC